MKASILLALAAVISFTTPTPATFESVLLTGRVTEAGTGVPLSGARIFVVGQSASGVSATDGTYRLTLPGDGWTGREARLRAELLGYTASVQTGRISGGTARVDFELTPAPVLAQEMRAQTEEAARGSGSLRKLLGVAADAAALPLGMMPVSRSRFDPEFNTESYAHIEDNGFLDVVRNPLSTFSIDVDRASYSNMRRFITGGTRPPLDAIRVEEMINYFSYDYPDPEGDHPFSITTEVGAAPWQPLHRLLRVGIQGERISTAELPPSNLVFVLDVSGSMGTPDKLPLLKSAFRLLVNQLRPEDRVSIVVYAGAAGLVLPATPGDQKDVILDAIENLHSGGSTAGGAGIRLAYNVAGEHHAPGGNNRVILATDGDFNIGASSDAEMIRLIEEKRAQGTFLTVLGFGTGNLKDSKMEQLADHGNGNFAYIDNLNEARKVLVSEIGGTLVTIAQDVKIQVEFNPTHVQAYRLIGYENRLLAAEDFNDDTKDAGELGAGHSVTALYEVVPVGVESPALGGVDPLRYQVVGGGTRQAASRELGFVKLRYKEPSGATSILLEETLMDADEAASGDLRFASAVAAFGMLLRESEYCQGFSISDVLRLARGSVGTDAEGYRREFVRIVEATRDGELLER